MNWQGPEFILVIVAICTIGWLVNNLIRARHGYALEDEWGGKTEHRDSAAFDVLAETNARLIARCEASEKRIATLETIVLDKGYDLGSQIEALRDTARLETPAKD